MVFLLVLSRWLHVVTACVAVGGVFFMRFILPRGLGKLEPDRAREAFLATRRMFKRVIHSAILLFLITGIYNTILAWDKYSLNPPLLHSLWGVHILGALVVFSISLYVLAGAEPPGNHRNLMAVNFCILLLVIAAASTLKWARETTVAGHAARPSSAETRW